MIVYDLKCSAGHAFEGWFEDLKDLKSQIRKGLVSCPVCGDSAVKRVPSSFAIAKCRPGSQPDQEMVGQVLGQALHRYLEENFEDVGAGFSKEALKIHYGASQARNIRGVSTPDEEKLLAEEGVSFFKVPTRFSPGPEDEEKH